MPLPRKNIIYLITDGTLTAANFSDKKPNLLEFLRLAIENKVSLIQIREKSLPARFVFELAVETVLIAQNTDTKILVNDRADIAIAAAADGVHLTAHSLSVKSIRDNFPRDFLIGVSAHSFEKAAIAKNEGANFSTLSPIFDSPNKGKHCGLNLLREVCRKLVPFPIIALGGIDETNYREILRVADGFAAIRFLNNSENLRVLRKVAGFY
jgi:thiamine-phosphate pyrophosphorylase